MATFCLMAAVFVLCTTRLGPYYIVRQPMVAVAIRMICINFGATGTQLLLARNREIERQRQARKGLTVALNRALLLLREQGRP